MMPANNATAEAENTIHASGGEDGVVESNEEIKENKREEDDEVMGPWRKTIDAEVDVKPPLEKDQRGYFKPHQLMLKDLWKEGNEYFRKVEVRKVRLASYNRE